LPEELWRQAAALAREHGLNKTSRALGLKYYSLKKHLDEMTTEQVIPAKAEPDFIELVPGVMTPGIWKPTVDSVAVGCGAKCACKEITRLYEPRAESMFLCRQIEILDLGRILGLMR